MSQDELAEYRKTEAEKQKELNKAQAKKLLVGLLEQLRAKEVVSVEMITIVSNS